MNQKKKIILDANILIRGVLGHKVYNILEHYQSNALYYTTCECFDDANSYLPIILRKQGHKEPEEHAAQSLNFLRRMVHPFNESFYSTHSNEAKRRIKLQDVEDWPLVALSLALNCPIWTEDRDFFGTGIPTWHSQTVKIYLEEETIKIAQ